MWNKIKLEHNLPLTQAQLLPKSRSHSKAFWDLLLIFEYKIDIVCSDGDWLNAYYDPVANINTHTNAMELADIFADGDYKLVAAHYSPIKTDLKLKVFKGASIIKESNLVDTPTALMSIYMDNLEPRVPGWLKNK